MRILKKAILSVIMLFGVIAINATENETWLQSGKLNDCVLDTDIKLDRDYSDVMVDLPTESMKNWPRNASLRATSEDETPPGEPWGAPVGNGIGYILAATGIYSLYKKRKTPVTTSSN